MGTDFWIVAMADAWDATLEEWVLSEGYCAGAAMAQAADGAFYAACPQAEEEGWKLLYAADHTEKILQDDGVTEKDTLINEAWNLKTLMETGKKPDGGCWIAGIKYNISQTSLDYESGDYTFARMLLQAPKRGIIAIKTPGNQIVCGLYLEEK